MITSSERLFYYAIRISFAVQGSVAPARWVELKKDVSRVRGICNDDFLPASWFMNNTGPEGWTNEHQWYNLII